VPRAFPGTNIVRNAYAAPGDPYFWGAVGFMSNGSMWYALAPETVLRVVAPLSPFRNDAGGQPIGDWSHCGMPGYTLCWTWAGTAHLEFERLPADLTLQQSPDTAIWAGQTVKFTAGADPATVPGNPYPIGVKELQWRWIPEDTLSADTLGCGSSSGMVCTRVMRGSGTMYASAYVNGQQQQKSIHLTVKVPTLDLSASKYVVAAPGENDTFTATANGSLTVLGWSFTPDGGGAADRLATSSASIGARTAKARSTASATGAQNASFGGLTVPTTSRRFASPGSAWDACTSGSAQCTNLVTETGTVDVLAIVNGDTLRVSVHITVIPCPTHDPYLDNPLVRSKLDSLWKLARVDTTKISSFRERTIGGYDSSGTLVVRILQLDTAATPCSNHVIEPSPLPGKKVFDAHVHPFALNDSLPKECDPTPPLKPGQYQIYGHTFGGLSSNDWNHTALTPPYPVYTFDRDSVYKGSPGSNQPYFPALKKYIPTDWQNFYQSWPRRGPGCEIVRY